MLKKRIIACLDVADGRVVKGVRFRDHDDVGDILELAERYSAQGIDELVFYDILASTAQRGVAPDWVAPVARCIDIPFCVAGGIRSLVQAEQVLAAGADKISINTPALEQPELIGSLVERFGSQCVVVGIDSLQDADGQWRVRSHTGNPDTTRERHLRTLDWIAEVQERGAGEIVLNCMASDGTRDGFDLALTRAVADAVPIPVIASGGVGTLEHLAQGVREGHADAVLAASIFHFGEYTIQETKRQMANAGIPVRL